jgi:putative ABC transport system substrate-binding protein
MKRKIMVLALGAMLFGLSPLAQAQQPGKVPRIGFLSGSRASANPPWHEALGQGLRELGYEEGKNIVIEWRYAEEKSDRVPRFAAELVHLKVDVIVAVGAGDTGAARKATTTVPIVTILAGDPGYGFVVWERKQQRISKL